MKVALLGAESTGKTSLAAALARHWQAGGQPVHAVAEYLRGWCEREGRTPQPHEQAGIAQEQARRALACPPGHWLVADTTPLMVAIYSDLLFDDPSLYRFALDHQRHYDLTLVTGLDLPWVPDGLQRDGPHVREPVDARLRAALARANVPYRVVYGEGDGRLAQVMHKVQHQARLAVHDLQVLDAVEPARRQLLRGGAQGGNAARILAEVLLRAHDARLRVNWA